MVRSLLALSFFLVLNPGMTASQHCEGEGEEHRPNATVAELIQDLSSDYWPRVWTAELRLESREAQSVPDLIKLTKNPARVQLRETWDLIYPGATTFYGHGYIVDYDLDLLSARAGWALENLTFQNFGFSDGILNHNEMFNATLSGKADKPLREVADLDQDSAVRQRRLEAAADRAERWWKQNAEKWIRLSALMEALASEDPLRAARAMNFVRNGRTRCTGFNPDFVKMKVLAVKNDSLAADVDQFRSWLVEMEKEKKDAFLYAFKGKDACY